MRLAVLRGPRARVGRGDADGAAAGLRAGIIPGAGDVADATLNYKSSTFENDLKEATPDGVDV